MWWPLWSSCICSAKKNSLDICIENPNLVFRRKDVGFSNILQLKKGHFCFADPGFDVRFCLTLCVNDAAQIREVFDHFYHCSPSGDNKLVYAFIGAWQRQRSERQVISSIIGLNHEKVAGLKTLLLPYGPPRLWDYSFQRETNIITR